MKKNWAVYKRIVGVGTTRINDKVEADSDYAAIVATIGNSMLSNSGAIGFMDTFWRSYTDRLVPDVHYFAGEVY